MKKALVLYFILSLFQFQSLYSQINKSSINKNRIKAEFVSMGIVIADSLYDIKSYKKALRIYEAAIKVEPDNSYIQHKIAVMYFNGEGVLKDSKKAIPWFEKAANRGDVPPQVHLGYIYFEGNGTLINFKKAFYWFEKAAKQGSNIAQSFLGIMYSEGKGVLKDYNKAFYWYEKAAKQDNAFAQVSLSYLYIGGLGVLKDLKKAKYWVEKAYDNGNPNAKEIWEKYKLWEY